MDDAAVTVDTWADLSFSKTDLRDPIVAGDVLMYQLRVINDGPSDAQGVVITDTVPSDTTFVGASDFCVAGGTTAGSVITCTVGAVSAGDDTSAYVQVEVDDLLLDGTVITNTAHAAAASGDSESATATTVVSQSSLNSTDLEIHKSSEPAAVVAGERLTYTLVVTNNGPAPATSVQVVDFLPNGVDLVSSSPSQGLCQANLACALGDLAVGDTATVVVVGDVDSGQIADLTNYARVSASNPDTNTSNNETSVGTAVDTEAYLTIQKVSAPTVATPGDDLAYEITISNSGPSDAQGVVVSDTMPSEVSGAVFSPSQGTCAGNVCHLGAIPAGDEATVSIVGTVDSAVTSPFVNEAEVDSSTLNLNADDGDDATTLVLARTDLALVKTGPATATAGELISYKLTVLHLGLSDAQDVVVTDTLPGGLQFVDASAPCSSVVTGTVVCTRPTLAVGGSTVFTVTAQANDDLAPGTRLENVAHVDCGTVDDEPANNTDMAYTGIVDSAGLTLSKTGPAHAIAGQQIAYTIVVRNNGPSIARDVDINDTLPPILTLDDVGIARSGSEPAVCLGALCQVGDVAVGEVITMTITTTIDSSYDGSAMTNTATLFTATPDGDRTDNKDTHTITALKYYLPWLLSVFK
jgi:uncharacterized repeat protein (TIGR01451 family)